MKMPSAMRTATNQSKTQSRSQSPQRNPSNSASIRDCEAAAVKQSVSAGLDLCSQSRLRIQYQSEELRTRSEVNLRRLFVEATDPENSSTNMKLAKKALKYRKILSRIEGVVDAQDPAFNASQVLRVTWVKYQTTE